MKHSIIHYSKSILHAAGRLVRNQRFCMILVLCVCTLAAFADDAGTSAGINALNSAKTSIVAYLPYVKNLCYAIAAVVAVVGAISVYIKMNNEEQDVKKSIMMIVGACVFLIAAAESLPLFFGETGTANP